MIEAVPNLDDQKQGIPPAMADLQALVDKSRFNSLDPRNPNTDIEAAGRKFTIETIDSSEHPDIPKVQALFEKTFGKEEVDPEEILRAAIDGRTPWGNKDATKYQVNVVKDEKGEVISTFAGGRLDLRDAENRPLGNKQMFMVAYAVTDKDARQGGLATEAYVSAIMQAAKDAQAEGKELIFAVGECTYTSEEFWNSIGWKRIYEESKQEPGAYKESGYMQPGLDFDPMTGKVAEGAGEVPEHLMLKGFGRTPPGKEDILAMVRGIYTWCNTWPQDAFKHPDGTANPEALAEHQKHVVGIWEKFKREVTEGGDLIFLDKKSREETMESGRYRIKEHTAADHGKAGKEDF